MLESEISDHSCAVGSERITEEVVLAELRRSKEETRVLESIHSHVSLQWMYDIKGGRANELMWFVT